MHDVRALFDAMDADGLLAFYVTAATCFTVIVLVQLAQLAWHYLEPHVFLLLDATSRLIGRHVRKELARESRYSDPARPRRAVPRSESSVGRVAPRATAADLSRRISRRSLEMADQRRPMWLTDSTDRRAQVGMNGNDAA
jgi:hypothetical protein